MKRSLPVAAVIVLLTCLFACTKTGFITSPDAFVSASVDTLHFDTVFTTTGSVSQAFKIFNHNDQKLRLSQVKLMGGANSAFRMNVDGQSTVEARDIELAPNDSIYVFLTVTINPNVAALPFIVRDSIMISYNGNNRFVQLDAFGQNANFLRNRRVTRDSTWNNELPFVILESITIDSNVTLTINKGTRIYHHADAPFIVKGTLKVNGEKEDSLRVSFQGDRLDDIYKDFPGAWPGIYFMSSSKDNVLNYAIIKNAYQGVRAELPAPNNQVKLTLNQCIIDNIYDIGVLGLATTISATNCLISNCGANIVLAAGGVYNFNHCTAASYSTAYLDRRNPVLFVSDVVNQVQTNALTATFNNSILYGEGGRVENEIIAERKGSGGYNVSFNNVLYRAKDEPANVTFTNAIKNQPPLFDSINTGRRFFNFRLQPNSPAKEKAINSNIAIDLDGKLRTGVRDLGCYEF